MKPILFALPLALGACGGVPDSRPEPEPTTVAQAAGQTVPFEQGAVVPEGSQLLAAVGDLIGEYRVAGIDGTELRGNAGIALSIDGPMLSFEPTCAGFVWEITAQRGRFTFARAKGYGPTRQPDGSFMVCAVAVSPEQRRLAAAIDAARHAWRTPSNGILLEGGGRSVMLFSQ